MALRERVFGLETEYAINFYATNTKTPGTHEIVKTLQELLVREYGLPNSEYLVSGGKFHYDVGHAEWAGPECLTAREAAIYDKAVDHLLAQVIPQTRQLLAIKGFEGELLVAKNNVDSVGNTYGCHENYQMLRSTEFLIYEHLLRYLIHGLIPFLVTRQIFAGTGGMVRSKTDGSTVQKPHFELSQRAAFIDTTISSHTMKERPIINLGREGEPLASNNYRRLHLILGDANLSGWATWLKLGTTGIVLRMIEDLFLGDVPLLLNPVQAIRSVAQDLTCKMPLPLRQGKTISALDIQWQYYELADTYLSQTGFSEEEDALMEAWEQTLTTIEQDVMQLRDRVDWVAKKYVLDTSVQQKNGSWEDLTESLLETLCAQDLRYHDVSKNGLFNRLFPTDPLVSAAAIEHAQSNPPSYTRAHVRGEAIKQARQFKLRVNVDNWDVITIGGKKISLPDPLEFSNELLEFDPAWWLESVGHQDPRIRQRAVAFLAWQSQPETLTLLLEKAQHDSDPQVRRAAVEALGHRADKLAQSVLIACLSDEHAPVRWAAQDALDRVRAGIPTPPSRITIETKEEPLTRIIF